MLINHLPCIPFDKISVFSLQMLKYLILVTLVTLCAAQEIGDDDYVPCESCRVRKADRPAEG